MRDDTIGAREEFEHILPMVAQAGGKFTREEALDAEIERLAEALRPYLEAFRESLVAEALMDAVTKTEFTSGVIEGMMLQLQDRVKEATKRIAHLEAERDGEIQQLRMVLRMRDELAKGEPELDNADLLEHVEEQDAVRRERVGMFLELRRCDRGKTVKRIRAPSGSVTPRFGCRL